MADIKVIKGEELRRMQLKLLECLVEVDHVCRECDIHYVIGFGTLLGAVRHGGFIPWDDDVDVCMTREDYDRFAKESYRLNPDICFFQDHDNESAYPWGYGKVRRTGTLYIRYGQEHLRHRSGLMIDIFPMDDIPRNYLLCKINEKVNFALRKLTYAKVAYRTQESRSQRIFYRLLSLVPLAVPHTIARWLQVRFNNKTPNRCHMKFFAPDALLRHTVPSKDQYGWCKEWLTDIVEYDFEGYRFWGPRDYDACLKWSFGPDYMKPPPAQEMESHAPCSEYKF